MLSNKEKHEAFISGHNGTTFIDVTSVTGISFASCFFRDAVVVLLLLQKLRTTKSMIYSSPYSKFLLDFTVLVLPSILSVTLLSNHIPLLYIGVLATNTVLFTFLVKLSGLRNKLSDLHHVTLSEKKQFVTYFRSFVNICTGIAILAVDFPIFPRRLAKAETYGFGGMDTGVSFFVVANAIVSPEARGRQKKLPFLTSLRKALISSVPLLVLGCGRLATVKGIEYQEHVTEYGVHWNFFFTLAALKILSTVVTSLIPPCQAGTMAVLVLVVHQFLLSRCGLTQYILEGHDGKGGRAGSLISANREGIFSLPGYLSIYLFGVHLGYFIFMERKSLSQWMSAAAHIAVRAIVFFVLMMMCQTSVQDVSRRFANATYVLWMVGTSHMMLLECLVGEIIITAILASQQLPVKENVTQSDCKSDNEDTTVSRRTTRSMTKNNSTSKEMGDGDDQSVFNKPIHTAGEFFVPRFCLLEAVTHNSLLFFLLANVMTGLVNLSLPTISITAYPAVGIIVCYMFVLCLIISVMKWNNISTKFW